MQAANYLNIKNLLDLTCQTVADMIKGKTPEEIRTTFNIKNDFTPEEEEEVRRENQWAFEWWSSERIKQPVSSFLCLLPFSSVAFNIHDYVLFLLFAFFYYQEPMFFTLLLDG